MQYYSEGSFDLFFVQTEVRENLPRLFGEFWHRECRTNLNHSVVNDPVVECFIPASLVV